MKEITVGGNTYRLPSSLDPFQEELYIHLIDWKWAHITREPGHDRGHLYDAILPDAYRGGYPLLYPAIVEAVQAHLQKYPFRIHKYFNHMASSQAANLNLFLPVLRHPNASAIFATVKPDLARLATSELDHGYRIEFWDEPFGNLNDKNRVSGTDADMAIAFYNHQGELCLWLIEHKLTERDFTPCNAATSRGRKAYHDCSKPIAGILADKRLCYYHDGRHFEYWNITERNLAFFANHAQFPHCPFCGGLNQLWRNQLLALSIEQDPRQHYKHVSFSVVKHPGNTLLDESLKAYRTLIAHNPGFTDFTSARIVAAAARFGDAELDQWRAWYQELYQV